MASTFVPIILSALLTPNPVQVGTSVTISVSAIDMEVIPSFIDIRSGEFQSGEW